MEINFYARQYLSLWADNYDEVRDKDNLKIYTGVIEKSYTATNGELIHYVNYENGTILVQDKDKI